MGAFVGLLLGIGLLLVWQGSSRRPRPPRKHPRIDRLREELAQAGLAAITPAQLIALQILAAFLVGLIGVALTRSLSVSVIFALFASAVPRLLVSRLRHRRQADLRELWPEVVDNLTSGVRAGLSLPEALSAIGIRGPEQLREPPSGNSVPTTAPPADSTKAWIDSRPDWRIRSATGSASRCGLPEKWVEPTSAGCSPHSPDFSATTPEPGRS